MSKRKLDSAVDQHNPACDAKHTGDCSDCRTVETKETQCEAMCESSQRCKRTSMDRQKMCWQHLEAKRKSDIQEAIQKTCKNIHIARVCKQKSRIIRLPKNTLLYRGMRTRRNVQTPAFYSLDIENTIGYEKAQTFGTVHYFKLKRSITVSDVTDCMGEIIDQINKCLPRRITSRPLVPRDIPDMICHFTKGSAYLNREDLVGGGAELFVCDPSIVTEVTPAESKLLRSVAKIRKELQYRQAEAEALLSDDVLPLDWDK